MCNSEIYIKQGIKTQLELAKKVEKVITPFLEKLANKCNGKLYGLDNKFKSENSALRKILSHIEDDMKENKNDSKYLDGKINELKDYLRYTIILNEENFTENVLFILKNLEENNYKMLDLKNRFKSEEYKDISSHYFKNSINFDNESIKIRFVFELQFHTEKTLFAKNVTHPLYEITREFETKLQKINDSIVENIYEAIRTLYKRVPIPVDVDKIKDKK